MEIGVGISGASGVAYAVRLLQALNRLDQVERVHLVISSNGFLLLRQEMAIHVSAKNFKINQLLGEESDKIKFYDNMDFFSPIASGSYPIEGMIVIPCSTGTLGAVASGASANLISRAAEVMLKERRRLVLVLRETPLSSIHLENCLRLSQAGATILPASPGFYHRPAEIIELIEFVVARALDQFHLPHNVGKRWGKKP